MIELCSKAKVVNGNEFDFVPSFALSLTRSKPSHTISSQLGGAQQRDRDDHDDHYRDASTSNLPFGDLTEEFIPANWSLSVAAVPEPGSASVVLALTVICGLRRSRG